MDLIIPAGIAGGVGGLVVGTFAAVIAAVRSYERSKEPKALSLAWVHEGLVEPAPFDTRQLIPPPLWAGGPTDAWPMILELRKETPALPGRDRFGTYPTIEGQVVAELPARSVLAIEAPKPKRARRPRKTAVTTKVGDTVITDLVEVSR